MSSNKPVASGASVLSPSNLANKLKPKAKPKLTRATSARTAAEMEPSVSEKENKEPLSDEHSTHSAHSASVLSQSAPVSASSVQTTQSKTHQTDTPERGRPSACVFVASLSSAVADDDLCLSVTSLFEKWGKISRVKVLRDTRNRPYAFVQYTKDEHAAIAIQEGHGAVVDDRRIRCEPAKVNRTLFVQLSRSMACDEVTKILEDFGPIERLVSSLYFNNPSLQLPPFSKGWFCQFVYRDDAITAFASLSQKEKLSVEWAQNIDTLKAATCNEPQKPRFDRCAIFIGQLSAETTEKELRERFKPHGAIESLSVVRNRDFNTFAFLRYASERSAAKAVEAENHSLFKKRTMHVQFREYGAAKKFNYSASGVALAPPPIRFDRRGQEWRQGGRDDENKYERRLSGSQGERGDKAVEGRGIRVLGDLSQDGRHERGEAPRSHVRASENRRWNRMGREFNSFAPPYSPDPFGPMGSNMYAPVTHEGQPYGRRFNGMFPNELDGRNPAAPYYYYVPETLYYGGYPYYLASMYSQDQDDEE